VCLDESSKAGLIKQRPQATPCCTDHLDLRQGPTSLFSAASIASQPNWIAGRRRVKSAWKCSSRSRCWNIMVIRTVAYRDTVLASLVSGHVSDPTMMVVHCKSLDTASAAREPPHAVESLSLVLRCTDFLSSRLQRAAWVRSTHGDHHDSWRCPSCTTKMDMLLLCISTAKLAAAADQCSADGAMVDHEHQNSGTSTLTSQLRLAATTVVLCRPSRIWPLRSVYERLGTSRNSSCPELALLPTAIQPLLRSRTPA
jgi:hypothetical protein